MSILSLGTQVETRSLVFGKVAEAVLGNHKRSRQRRTSRSRILGLVLQVLKVTFSCVDRTRLRASTACMLAAGIGSHGLLLALCLTRYDCRTILKLTYSQVDKST